jgi:hypothetical protein
MPDEVVVVEAAFGGGLAGAILQPLTSYAMDGLRSGDRKRMGLERNLRRMITNQILYGMNLKVAIGANAYLEGQARSLNWMEKMQGSPT